MKIEVRFLAETPEDLKKLQVTLAAFSSGSNGAVTHVDFSMGALNTEPPVTPPATGRATRTKKVKTEEVPAPVETTNDFEFDFGAEEQSSTTEEVIDLEAIRDLVNEKAAAGHAVQIRNIMGSFAVAALSAIKPAQFAAFYKSISAIK